jgi:hypothetical protein
LDHSTGPAPGRDAAPSGAAPISIRWNEESGRFQFYDCVIDEADEISCRFETELLD